MSSKPRDSSAHSSLLFVVVALGAALDMAMFRTIVIVIVCLTSYRSLAGCGEWGCLLNQSFAGSLLSYLVFHVPVPYITSLTPLGSWGEGGIM